VRIHLRIGESTASAALTVSSWNRYYARAIEPVPPGLDVVLRSSDTKPKRRFVMFFIDPACCPQRKDCEKGALLSTIRLSVCEI
jgi:hypothetical protein